MIESGKWGIKGPPSGPRDLKMKFIDFLFSLFSERNLTFGKIATFLKNDNYLIFN